MIYITPSTPAITLGSSSKIIGKSLGHWMENEICFDQFQATTITINVNRNYLSHRHIVHQDIK